MAPFHHAYTELTADVAPRASRSPGGDQQSRSTVFLTEFEDGHSSRRTAVHKFGPFVHNNAGLLMVAAAQVFASLMNTSVKILHGIDPPVSTLELVVVRMAMTYTCCITFMLIQKVPDPFLGPKEVRPLLIVRGLSGFFGISSVYYSLKYLPLSDATVLTFLGPLGAAIAAALILKEKFTLKEALAGIFSLVGVVLIARPEFLFGVSNNPQNASAGDSGDPAMEHSQSGTPYDRLVAVGAALVGVVTSAGAYTSIRAIGKRAHPLHLLSYFSFVSIVAASVGMLITRTSFVIPTRLLWLGLLAIIGICGFITQLLFTMGLQRETAGRGTMAVYSQVIFAMILERIFFHTLPSLLSMVGTVIIIASALYVALNKEKEVEVENAVSLERLDDASLEEGLLDHSRMANSGNKTPEIHPNCKSDETHLQSGVDSDHEGADPDKAEDVGE